MRWGLAGYGNLAPRIVDALRRAEQRLEAVWGRDRQRVRDFADRWRIGRATDDLDELCAEVDAVYVATPVATHVAIAATALARGRHVLIEKPISPCLQPASRILSLADLRGGVVGVAYYRRLFPLAARVRELLTESLLGPPREVTVSWSGPFAPAADDPMAWRTDPKVAGAGVLADAGSHRLDLLIWLHGAPAFAGARLSDRFPAGAERRAWLRLAWQDGLVAETTFNWSIEHRDQIRWGWDAAELTADLGSGRLTWTAGPEVWTEDHPPPDHPHQALIADFVAAIREGRSPVCSLADGLITDRIIESAVASSRNAGCEEPIDLPDQAPPRLRSSVASLPSPSR